ncbi:MerR family transcriptional regulator [Knoellia sp. CPCC 206453]|uniref:MerR family transcriptional regulator n=1 Tax=Knoellia pratensis TaxID=3404796 RepID=UPI00360F2748
MESQVERWASERRAGVGPAEIARREGYCHQWISRQTKPYGPFPRSGTPSAATIEKWVAERKAGRSAERVARENGVTTKRVREATRHAGPFPARLHVDGFFTLSELADELGVPSPTICHWSDTGFLPAPERRGGRRLWPVEYFNEWLATAELETCPACGARTRDQSRHAGHAHR